MFISQKRFKSKHRKKMDKTDVYTNFDTLVKEMEWGDVVSTIKDVLVEMNVEAEDPLHSLLGLPLPSSASGPGGPAVLDSNRTSVQKTDILNEGHCSYEHGSTALQYLEEKFAPEAYIRHAGALDKGPLYSTIWSPDMYNQEVGCHPGQVTHNLYQVKCLLNADLQLQGFQVYEDQVV